MIRTQKQRNLFLYPLNVRQSGRVFEQALRVRASVTLIPKLPDSPCLEGALESRTAESVWVLLAGGQVPQGPSLQSVCCDGELALDGTMYIFASNVLSMVQHDGRTRLEIALPEELNVVQRRRFSRTAMRESRPVTLSSESADGGSGWSCTACLLNLSANGLACRADHIHADRITVGQELNLSFRLESSPDTIICRAALRSKTPAGSEGCVVLGFEFTEQSDSNGMERLRQELSTFGSPE